jgi:uncharacterized protein (TIGR03067 family)
MFALQGTWSCVSAQNDGKVIPEEITKQLRLDINRTNYTTRRGDQVLFEGTIRVDPAKEPMEIDITDQTGENKGKTGKGIYHLDDKTFTLCHGMPSNPDRPKEFVSKPGSGLFLVVWERQNPSSEPEV